MDFRTALKNQHHAALSMLSECLDPCPEELWLSGQHPRKYWRIVYHAAAYTHLYLYESMASWNQWPKHRLECTYIDDSGGPIAEVQPYTIEEVQDFVQHIHSEVDGRLDALDLDADECGYPWYPGLPRAELLILNLRHLHGHLGQLHEMRLAHGLDLNWQGPRKV